MYIFDFFFFFILFFFKQKTAYEIKECDWSSDVCSSDLELGSSFVIETENFKDALINHTFVVEKIVIPEELKSGQDFAKIREESKREGKIIRDSIIDEKESTKEFPFIA